MRMSTSAPNALQSGAWSELVGHSSTVAGVAFCSQSRRLFSAGGETILAWRIA